MFWIVIAAQLSAPVPKNLGSWFDYRDVPESILRAGNGAWRGGICVDVTPGGSIRRCTGETSSRGSDLDRLSCGLVVLRAKFEPARWKDGSPAYGVYRSSVSWTVGENARRLPPPSYPDLDLLVRALPSGTKNPALVRVMFAVDADGA